jgi:hypothetical protein
VEELKKIHGSEMDSIPSASISNIQKKGILKKNTASLNQETGRSDDNSRYN